MKIKFKRKINRNLGTVRFFGVPRLSPRPRSLRFKSNHVSTSPAFGSFVQIPQVRSISLFSPSMKRPAATFYGDSDGDGVMNGLDCAPLNSKKQGPQHAKMFGQDGEYIGDEEQSFMDADEDREFEEGKKTIEHKQIHDFGVSFNKKTREKLKAKSNKTDSDDAQSLIDLS